MDSFLELITTVQSDLNINDNSTVYPLVAVKLALNRAYRKAGALYRWPKTDDAKKTSANATQEYYDYPINWRPNSIYRITVDGDRYGESPDGSPLVFSDFLRWKEDNPTSTDKKWASQWQRFFISPVPTVTGSNNICIWGQKVVDLLVNNIDTTIFSYTMPECNDAIVLEAEAILKAKGEDKATSQFKSAQAQGILASSWMKIKQEMDKYEKNDPLFEVVDMFPPTHGRSRRSSNIGNFS